MADVLPLMLDEQTGDLTEMTVSQKAAIRGWAGELYRANPSVIVTQGSVTGSTLIGTLYDGYYTYGLYSVSNTSFSSNPPNPRYQTNTWRPLFQSFASLNPPQAGSTTYPVYYLNNQLRSMTYQDMIDTFIFKALDNVRGIVYKVHSGTTLSGYTKTGGTVFIDTYADTAAYASSDLVPPYTGVSRVNTGKTWYFFKGNANFSGRTLYTPAVIDGSGNPKAQNPSTWETILSELCRYAAVNTTGCRIRYNWNGTGVSCGVVSDSSLSPLGILTKNRQVNDNYYAQDFPSGTVQVTGTYTLRANIT
jgi:hypothetical protein